MGSGMPVVTIHVKYNVVKIFSVHVLHDSELFRGYMFETFTHMDAQVHDNTWCVARRM